MKSTETNQKKDEKAAAKKRAAAIKLHAKKIFNSAVPEYIAFFLQNRGAQSQDERTSSIIGLAERSIDYAEAFDSAWKRKRGKFLAV